MFWPRARGHRAGCACLPPKSHMMVLPRMPVSRTLVHGVLTVSSVAVWTLLSCFLPPGDGTRQAAHCETLLASTSGWLKQHATMGISLTLTASDSRSVERVAVLWPRYLECSVGRQIKACDVASKWGGGPPRMCFRQLCQSQVADLWASCQKNLFTSVADDVCGSLQ